MPAWGREMFSYKVITDHKTQRGISLISPPTQYSIHRNRLAGCGLCECVSTIPIFWNTKPDANLNSAVFIWPLFESETLNSKMKYLLWFKPNSVLDRVSCSSKRRLWHWILPPRQHATEPGLQSARHKNFGHSDFYLLRCTRRPYLPRMWNKIEQQDPISAIL